MKPKFLVVFLFLQILTVIAYDASQSDCKEDTDCPITDRCIQGQCFPVRDYGEECLHDDQCSMKNTLCQQRSGQISDYGMCLCRSDLVFAWGECRTPNPLGNQCNKETDCTSPRSTCGEGKCQCRFIADKFGNCLGGFSHECQDDSECATEAGLACIEGPLGKSRCWCRESYHQFDEEKCQNKTTDIQSCKTFLTCPDDFMCNSTLRQCVPLKYDQPWFVKCRKDDAYCPPGHYCELSAGVCLAIKSQDEPRYSRISLFRNPYFWMKVTFIGIASVMAIALLIKMFGRRRRKSPPNVLPSAPSVSSATTHLYYPSTISPNPKVQSAYPSLHAV